MIALFTMYQLKHKSPKIYSETDRFLLAPWLACWIAGEPACRSAGLHYSRQAAKKLRKNEPNFFWGVINT